MKQPTTRILIAGAGYAGLLFTMRLAGKVARQHVQISLVSHPGLKAQGLCLNSTAVRHTDEGVPLWFQRSTHQGQPTSAPYLPNLVEQATFASPRFWHPPDQRGACNDSADRRTASLCWADWRH